MGSRGSFSLGVISAGAMSESSALTTVTSPEPASPTMVSQVNVVVTEAFEPPLLVSEISLTSTGPPPNSSSTTNCVSELSPVFSMVAVTFSGSLSTTGLFVLSIVTWKFDSSLPGMNTSPDAVSVSSLLATVSVPLPTSLTLVLQERETNVESVGSSEVTSSVPTMFPSKSFR